MKGARVDKRILVISLAAVAVLGIACGGDEPAATTGTGTDTGADTGADTDSDADADTGGTVTLTAAGFAFDPSELSAPAGGTIEFTNADEAPHTFTAEEAGIDVQADPGGSATIDLAGVEPGTYDFLCTIHPDTMTGTLEVTE